MTPGKKLRILIAKPGLDGHDRGAKVVARALSNAGMEVLYSGLHQTPEQIVATALDEDVAAIGLSILSGAHRSIFSRVMALLREKGAADVLVFGGGTIPKRDLPTLETLGVERIFGPGTDTREIVAYLESRFPGLAKAAGKRRYMADGKKGRTGSRQSGSQAPASPTGRRNRRTAQ